MDRAVLIAFLVTLGAGLCTGIGSILAFFTSHTNRRFFAFSLGFSAGVMIYVSMIEIFFKGQEALIDALGASRGRWVTVLAFFGGMGVIALIDRLVPTFENPHEPRDVEDVDTSGPEKPYRAASTTDRTRMFRVGLMTALAITIHNFPEGIATFLVTLRDPAVGLTIGVAIALHNIPEGIAVSVPIYFATGSRRKAFIYSFLSGLAEPVGAILGYLVLRPYLTDTLFGILFAGVGGIMVFISLDQLLPSAQRYGEHHLSIYGMVAGMGIMALSLLLMG